MNYDAGLLRLNSQDSKEKEKKKKREKHSHWNSTKTEMEAINENWSEQKGTIKTYTRIKPDR